MSQWVPVIIVGVYLVILIATWTWIWRQHALRGSAYTSGFDAGWMQHVGAQLSEDTQYQRAFTEGWCACLDTLDTQTPGWQSREAEYRNRPTPAPGGPFASPPDVPAIPEFDEKGIKP
jgi:hypothetical protein